MLRVIAIGKKHESWVHDGIERYQKRLKNPFAIEWILLPHSSREGVRARQEESERIAKRVSSDDFVILLDEIGNHLTSPALSNLILERSALVQVTFVIGGAYGVSDALKNRADFVWSLSSLVFPHQLVRLILAEQLYRSQSIADNHPYHHA